MTSGVQDKWDQRYRHAHMPTSPCSLLTEHADLLPSSGRALDLACGLGGNAVYLAQAGLDVDAVDLSPVATRKLEHYAALCNLAITARCRDVEEDGLNGDSYEVIVVSYFLHRPLLPLLASALQPGGLLFYQTFNRLRASTQGPKSDKFLLIDNELPNSLAELEILLHRQDVDSGRPGSPLQTCYIGRARTF